MVCTQGVQLWGEWGARKMSVSLRGVIFCT